MISSSTDLDKINNSILKACGEGNIDLIKAYIKRKKSFNFANSAGITPLMMAAACEKTAVLHQVLRQVTQEILHAIDSHGFNALSYACYSTNSSHVDILREKGVAELKVSNSGNGQQILGLAKKVSEAKGTTLSADILQDPAVWEQICVYFKKNPPPSVEAAIRSLEKEYGIRLSKERTTEILKRAGIEI